MATRNVSRRKVATRATAVRSVDPASLKSFRAARQSLEIALVQLRSARAGLQDQSNKLADGTNASDNHLLIEQAWSALDQASESLFQTGSGDSVAYRKASPILDSLFDTMDVVRLASHCTKACDGKLPAGGEATTNPVRGGLCVAIERTAILEQRIAAFTKSVRTARIPGSADASEEAA